MGITLRLTVTNEERFALATMLIQAAWGSDERALNNFLAAFEAFGLEEYRPLFNGDKVPSDHPKLSATIKREVKLSQGAAREILGTWPQHATPAALGPAKVRLLQRMRALAPAEKPAKEPG